jgi:predicted Zn-dependent protease
MSKAGFDPQESVILWEKMTQASQGGQQPEFMSTHPSNATRIQNLQRHMPTMLQVQQQARANGKQPSCTK